MRSAPGAMGAVVAAWLLLAPLFTGVGLLVLRAAALRAESRDQTFAAFWLGWAATIALLQVWHLFLPISWHALVLVGVTGAAGLLLGGRELAVGRPSAPAPRVFAGAVTAAAGLLVTIVTANVAIGLNHVPDTGLYHLPAVRWIRSYPIVPGLGNLHVRLAFNDTSFLYAALLELGPFRARHVSNGLLLVVLALQAVAHLPDLLTGRGRIPFHGLFLVVLLPALAWSLVEGQPAAIAPDFVLLCLAAVVMTQLVESASSGDDAHTFRAFVVCLLSVVGVTVKGTFAAFGALATGVALAFWLRGTPTTGRVRGLLATLATLVAALWCVRSIILSGYPMFPAAIAAMPVEWRMPRASVVRFWDANWRWARAPGLDTGAPVAGWAWVSTWWPELVDKAWQFRNPALLAALSLVVLAARAWRRGRADDVPWWVLVPPAGAVMFWFLTAPDIRLGGWAVWMLAATAAVLLAHAFSGAAERGRLLVVPMLALAAWGCVDVGRLFARDRSINRTLQEYPAAWLREYTTRSGLVVHHPGRGDQCFDAPLPCAPYPSAELSLRRPGDLGSGFEVMPFDDAALVGLGAPPERLRGP